MAGISKRVKGAQSFLHDRWYEKNQQYQIQPMWYSELNSERVEIHIQKSIQYVLEEQNLWISKELKLEYFKPKCTCYVEKIKCKEYVKAKQCKSCKDKKKHSNPKCISQRRYDVCVIKKDICSCIVYILCIQYNNNTIKNYEDCKKMSKKHENTSK